MNFDQMKLKLLGEVTLNYGKFISTVINFLITYKGYNSAVEFIIIGLSRHEKDLVFWFWRIWSDVRTRIPSLSHGPG